MIRAAHLESRTVTTVAGTGKRGEDPNANNENMREQNLSSPYDISYDKELNIFYVAMAGIHQIWKMDIQNGNITPFIGNGIEGCHDDANEFKASTLAQPFGVSVGNSENGTKELFIADSESSSIRASNLVNMNSTRTIVGGDGTSTNLF